VVGERREIVGEKEKEVGVPALGCNEVLCVFLSFSTSLSLSFLRNGTVRAMSTFINRHNSGSARSLVFQIYKKSMFCTQLYCQSLNKVNMTTSLCSAI